MARVLLVVPPSKPPMRTPLLAYAYLIAALRAGGHEGELLDTSALDVDAATDSICRRAAGTRPDAIGVHLKTEHVRAAYLLAARLSERLRIPLVAGGPHATCCAEETLRHDFAFALRGEAETAIVQLASALDGTNAYDRVEGLSYFAGTSVRHVPASSSPLPLDALPDPHGALDAFDGSLYPAGSWPGGILSSRGCPSQCTFCANQVTGRTFRYHSAGRVLREVRTLTDRFDCPCFTFFDDSFSAGRRRVLALCDRLATMPGLSWSCTAHAAHLDDDVLVAMKRAGCIGIGVGVETGDPAMLEQIRKGVTLEQVSRVLRAAAATGIQVHVDLMIGFPHESEAQMDNTLRFVEEWAPWVAGFNARGVVVPYPGTPLYDEFHHEFGFSEWWLNDPPLALPALPAAPSWKELREHAALDPALDRNFFRHSSARLDRMRSLLEVKAQVTWEKLSRRSGG